MPNNIEVGERIRQIRESLQMTREKFSEMIDVSDVFLGQIERGERSLSLKTLSKIVSYTGSSSDFILFGNNKNNSTIDKINRILNKSSDENIEYIYKIIHCSNTFFKTLLLKIATEINILVSNIIRIYYFFLSFFNSNYWIFIFYKYVYLLYN